MASFPASGGAELQADPCEERLLDSHGDIVVGAGAGAQEEESTRRTSRLPAALGLGALMLMAAMAAWSRSAPVHSGMFQADPRKPQRQAWAYMEPDVPREKCGPVEDNVDFEGDLLATIVNVQSATMCCAACSGYPDCRAWTWGKNFSKPGVGGTCWVKAGDFPEGAPEKTPNEDVMSGLPHAGVVKFGVVPAPPQKTEKWDGVTPKDVGDNVDPSPRCPGKLAVEGYGAVTLVNADKSNVEVLSNDAVVSHIKARSYWADWCEEGVYSNKQYQALNPLGKTIRYTLDISGTACGCNAAFYLSAMKQNDLPGNCGGDFYCDVMSVCDVPCIEIDLQEANQYTWRTTLHAKGDFMGKSLGYGGSEDSPIQRDWTSKEYSPGGECIDTSKPFHVAISFPVHEDTGDLRALEVELTQDGKDCPLRTSMDSYGWGWPPPQKDGFAEVTQALRAGMTPVMSYWKSDDMLWMDGLGEDGRGPCVQDSPDQCPEYVRFLNFSIESYKEAKSSSAPEKV